MVLLRSETQCVSSLEFTLQDIPMTASVALTCTDDVDCTTIERSKLQFDGDNLISPDSQVDVSAMSDMVHLVKDLMDLETIYSQVTSVSATYSVCAVGKTQQECGMFCRQTCKQSKTLQTI